MPTIKDVAREAGVSIATVSYVLNKKNNFVSEKTRQQVLEAIQRVGYTPNTTARNLKANQTRLIGYAWHKIPDYHHVNPMMDSFIYYLAQAAEASGYHLLTFTHPSGKPEPVYDEMIRSGRVDAFILAETIRDDGRIEFLRSIDYPFVCFGRSNPDWDFPWVDTDGQTGMREAVNYLVEMGHRRIAMAAWPEGSISGDFRTAGYVDGLVNAGLPVRAEYLVRGEHNEQTGREAVRYWLEMPSAERPTAIVAVSDIVAIGILNEIEERGMIPGRDLSVIGFDYTPLVQYLRPALTTIEQAIPETGQALMRMLEAVLNKDDSVPMQLLLPPQLIPRNSCGAPP
ncbi:MAG: LacI family DNA-binding transcriptional regulator [Anaerolineae bacterium]|nr:LacI family DNA-binding transcriptional regulator [Anaerolineae bacterium]